MEQEYNFSSSSSYYCYYNHPNTTATPPPSFDHPNVLIDSHDCPIRPYSSPYSAPVLPAAVANLHAGNYSEKKKKGIRGNDNGHSSSSGSVNNKKGKVGGEGGSAGVKLSTDPQSIAARERRHRISNRFKILQSLVPGGAKLDTVSMLEQAIQYVKYLKTQIWIHQTIINNNTTDHHFPHTHDHDHQNSFSSHDWPPYAAALGGGGDQNDCGGDSGGDCYGMYQQGSFFLSADDHGDAMMMPSLPSEIAQASFFGCDDNMYSDGMSVNYYS